VTLSYKNISGILYILYISEPLLQVFLEFHCVVPVVLAAQAVRLGHQA